MMNEFLHSETKLMFAWVGAAAMTLLNKFGFVIEDYQLWKIIALDVLTATSLIVAIGYTISRWRKLIRDNKTRKVK